MKKTVSLVLTFVMLISCLTVLPFNVSAAIPTDVTEYKLGDTFVAEYNSITTKNVQYYAKFIPETTDYYEFAVDTHFKANNDGQVFTYIIDSKDNEINFGYDFDSRGITATVAAKLTAHQIYYFAMELSNCKFYKYTTNVTIQKHEHTYKKVTYPAFYIQEDDYGDCDDGCTFDFCDCGYQESESIIYMPQTFKLSATSYTYDGKAKKPSATVKDRKGNVIDNEYYTVSYPMGRKNVGQYTVMIEFKSDSENSKYIGRAKRTFTIKPKSTSLSKVTAGRKAITVKWKKQAAQTTGYQIQYATDKSFKKNKKTVTISKNKTVSEKITKLKAKKKYYVRVRTYKEVKVDGEKTKIYSDWSKTKIVKTK